MISIVTLLAHPKEVTPAELRERFGRALGVTFGEGRSDENVLLHPKPELFPIKVGNLFFGMINSHQRYLKKPPAHLDRYDTRVRQAILYHHAWCAIDMTDATAAASKPAAYAILGKMMAELIDDNCMALYSTETGKAMWIYDGIADRLRSGDPLSAFSNPVTGLVNVPAGDAEMTAAVAEARRRWPEFVAAFAARRRGQGFSVKAPVSRDGVTEHIWITPTEITPDRVRGQLANEPRNLTGLTYRDAVEFDVKDLTDWLFEDGKTNRGGFTVEVLRRRAEPR